MQSTTELVEQMAKGFYDEYRKLHKNTDDATLNQIVYKNTSIVESTPVNPNNFKNVSQLYAEAMVCKEIQERRKAIAEFRKEFPEVLDERKQKAILNLPVSSSFIGQLIVAIIEYNDGISPEEILKFGHEEISKMDLTGLISLLEKLEKEGSIFCKDNKCYFLVACSESLLPKNPVEYAKKVYIRNGIKWAISEREIEIINKIQKVGKPLVPEEFDENYVPGKFYYTPLYIEELINNRILAKWYERTISDYVYYFSMLGEKEEDM